MKYKRAAILSLSFLTIMSTDTVAPLVGQISASFPDVNPTLIKLTITLPSLMMIFFGLIASLLVKVISKKAVLAIGLILYTIGGIAAGWAQTFMGHLILRAILGAGTGLIIPLVTSLIADFYKGKERVDMIGYSFSVSHMAYLCCCSPDFPIFNAFHSQLTQEHEFRNRRKKKGSHPTPRYLAIHRLIFHGGRVLYHHHRYPIPNSSQANPCSLCHNFWFIYFHTWLHH